MDPLNPSDLKIVKHMFDKSLFEREDFKLKFSSHRSWGFTPKYILIHNTEGGKANTTVDWFRDPRSRVSAHLVIGRDGKVFQTIRFDLRAWHAGAAHWDGYRALDRHALGIELANWGPLKLKDGQWWGKSGDAIPEERVLVARHKFGTEEKGWEIHPEEQIERAALICRKLFETYGLRYVIGHDDISQRRKWDPGPAFPMESFRWRVMSGFIKPLIVHLLLHKGTLEVTPEEGEGSPDKFLLEKGTRVRVIEHGIDKVRVQVLGEIENQLGRVGWLSNKILRQVVERVSDQPAGIEPV